METQSSGFQTGKLGQLFSPLFDAGLVSQAIKGIEVTFHLVTLN